MRDAVVAERPEILDLFNMFLSGWAIGDPIGLASVFIPSAALISSAHGNVNGAAALADVLAMDWLRGQEAQINSTNHYVGVDDKNAVLGAYLYGQITTVEPVSKQLLFGALVVADLIVTDKGWLFTQLHLTVTWVEGDRELAIAWTPPRPRRLWEVGDSAPHLINELDSPWTRLPGAQVAGSAEDQVSEVFMRYIWAMDQADFGQMSGTLSSDIAGAFPPIGDLKGRHEVMGQLKNFRQPWPWMQHFCVPLHVEINHERATMLLGRVIAQRPLTDKGLPLFGAHYRIQLRKEAGHWLIFWFEYIEGWITAPTGV